MHKQKEDTRQNIMDQCLAWKLVHNYVKRQTE